MLGGRRITAAREEGLAGTALVIVIAWALAAVMMLTGTLIGAQQIDERVALIVNEVSEIDDDLDSVELAQETNEIAQDILAAAEPLSGQLDEVISAAGGIDQSVTSILSAAGEINDAAGAINTAANSINENAKSIGASVDGIDQKLTGVLSSVRSIEQGVTAINVKAADARSVVQAIRADLDRVLALIRGHGTPTDANLHGHANSIDCSPLVAPQSRRCGD